MKGMKSARGGSQPNRQVQPPSIAPRPPAKAAFREHEVKCTCGARMRLKSSAYGWFYGCATWPACEQKVGAHADGRPMGRPGTPAERAARIEAHAVFDMLWRLRRRRASGIFYQQSRRAAYSWMQTRLRLTEEQAHIGQFNVEQCCQLVAAALEVLLEERLYEAPGGPR